MTRTNRPWRIVVFASVLCSVLALASPETKAQVITLNFADGLPPSAKGWTFQGQDQFQQPLTESQVAAISGGILRLDTAPFGGVGSNETFAFWRVSTIGINPSNYEYEIRMRAIAPNSFRSCFGGLLGAGIEVRGSFDSDITVTPPNLYLAGFTPASSSDPCFVFALDASIFHTYKLVVQNDTQATLWVDGVQVAQGTLIRPNNLSLEAVFGDISTSGGNVTAEIESIRIASLAMAVTIDIKPGDFPNRLNPDSNGVIAVAILTTPTFNAATVNSSTVRFGANGMEAAPVQTVLQDVDGDGDIDQILHFRTQSTGIRCGTTSASLTGKTFNGQLIEGADSVSTVGCN
jgi:hypothetical protein